MELNKALNWRYATKRMNGERVDEQQIEAILEAIRLAPTSLGLQPFNVLVIQDSELKERILPIASGQKQIVDCSHLLVFAAWNKITSQHVDEYILRIATTRKVTVSSLDQFKSYLNDLLKKTDVEFFNWAARQAYLAFGIGIAAAAEAKVDATPMEGFDNHKLDQLLHLEEKGLSSVTILPIGHRDAEHDWLVKQPKVRRAHDELFIYDMALADVL